MSGPSLVLTDPHGARTVVALDPARGVVTIGRRREADVTVEWDPEVSRVHAELVHRAGEWTISDEGLSQNGTYVNELRLEGRRRLRDGDLIRVGRTRLEFRTAPDRGGGVTLAPGQMPATPQFSELQQRVLAALCRPLLDDSSARPATDSEIAAETGEPRRLVADELDQLARAFGIEAMPPAELRAEIALLALRTGLASG